MSLRAVESVVKEADRADSVTEVAAQLKTEEATDFCSSKVVIF